MYSPYACKQKLFVSFFVYKAFHVVFQTVQHLNIFIAYTCVFLHAHFRVF